MRYSWQPLGLILFTASAAFGGRAEAQATSDSNSDNMAVEEIIVTAQRRAENMQDVPIPINVLSSNTLAAAGVASTTTLQTTVPGLNMHTQNGGAQPHLRGVGTNSANPGIESSVATYVDGVYYSSLYGSTFNLNNIDRIEVLKGPQGTLFGRNATGGLIHVITKDPTDAFHINASIGYGNYDTVTGSLYVTGGLTDDLAADLAAYVSHQGDGYGTNSVTGSDVYRTQDYMVRSKWLWKPGDRSEITLSLDYDHVISSGFSLGRPVDNFRPQLDPGNVFTSDNPWDLSAALDPRVRINQGGASLRVQHDFDFAQFVSISAYREVDNHTIFNPDNSRFMNQKGIYDQKDKQFSQELQLLSPKGSALNWVLGAYYIGSSSRYDPLHVFGTSLGGTPYVDYFAGQRVRAFAAFAQASYEIAPKTNLTLGIRYTTEKHYEKGHNVFAFPFPVPAIPGTLSPGCPVPGPCVTNVVDTHETWNKPTWRVSLDHHFTDDIMGYISYDRGFKSGAFNVVALTSNQGPIDPETLDAYQAGIKSQLLNDRVRINLSGFYYDYKNIQVTVYTLTSALIQNGPRARMWGGDLDAEFRIARGLSLSAGMEVMHSEFVDYPNALFFYPNPVTVVPPGSNPNSCVLASVNPNAGGNCRVTASAKGKQIPVTPEFTGYASLNYSTPVSFGTLDFNFSVYHNGGWFAGSDNSYRQKAYTLLNAQIGWQSADERFRVTLWGKNLTKKAYANYLSVGTAFANQSLAPPRTYGVRLSYAY